MPSLCALPFISPLYERKDLFKNLRKKPSAFSLSPQESYDNLDPSLPPVAAGEVAAGLDVSSNQHSSWGVVRWARPGMARRARVTLTPEFDDFDEAPPFMRLGDVAFEAALEEAREETELDVR